MSWKCNTCTFVNPETLTKCSMCFGTRKKRKRDDHTQWTCSRCTLINDMSRTNCEVCRAPNVAKVLKKNIKRSETNNAFAKLMNTKRKDCNDVKASRNLTSITKVVANNAFTKSIHMTNYNNMKPLKKLTTVRSKTDVVTNNAFTKMMRAAAGKGMHFHLEYVQSSQTFRCEWRDCSSRKDARSRGREKSRTGWYNEKTILKKINAIEWNFEHDSGTKKIDVDLILTTNLPSAKRNVKHVMSRCKLAPSILKSAIQKSVRRCETRRALKCAAELVRRSKHEEAGGKNQFLDLVRRAIIIAIEDVVLHPDIPVLAWIMAACSKGYIASDVHFHFVLRFIRDLANSPYREPCIRDDEDREVVTEEEVPKLKHEISKLIVRSLLLRKKFGGMKGDMIMLSNAAKVWARRLKYFSSDTKMRDLLFNSSSSTNVINKAIRDPLLEADINSAAIDFHCCPRMIDDILRESNRTDVHDKEDFRSAMWYFRSGLNRKRVVRLSLVDETTIKIQTEVDHDTANTNNSTLKSFWDLFEKKVEKYSRNIISNGFRR